MDHKDPEWTTRTQWSIRTHIEPRGPRLDHEDQNWTTRTQTGPQGASSIKETQTDQNVDKFYSFNFYIFLSQ